MFIRPPTPPDAKASPSGLKARVFTGVMWPFSRKTQEAPTSDHREDCSTVIRKPNSQLDHILIMFPLQNTVVLTKCKFTTGGRVGPMSCSRVKWVWTPDPSDRLLQPVSSASTEQTAKLVQLKIYHFIIYPFLQQFYHITFNLCIYVKLMSRGLGQNIQDNLNHNLII